MKTILLSIVFFSLSAPAAEIVDVHNQIPMTNGAPRTKDYYLSSDGVSLKKDLVVKIFRSVNISKGKKNIGEVKVEIGQLRILAVSDKVAVAREYKLFSKDQVPLTEAVGFMVGDQVDASGSFLDNSKRKPNGEEAARIEPAAEDHANSSAEATPKSLPATPDVQPAREPSAEHPVTPDANAETQKIEVKIFPDKI